MHVLYELIDAEFFPPLLRRFQHLLGLEQVKLPCPQESGEALAGERKMVLV